MKLSIAAILFLAISGAAVADASDCSVRVHVYDPAGRLVEDVPVTLQMDAGGPPRKSVSTQGTAEFCDVGWGTFSITVGPNLCGQIIVRNLYIRWTRPLDIPVTYENCHGITILDSCLVMLRFSDSDGKPLNDVQVERRNRIAATSDRYGRAVIALDFNTSIKVQALLHGYQTKSVPLTCERARPRVEQSIRLERSEQ